MDIEQLPPRDDQQAAEDAATFGMEGAIRQGDLSVEVTRSNSRRMVMVWLLVGAISVMLVSCIAFGAFSYVYLSHRAEQAAAGNVKKKVLPPPKEMKVLIKTIDRDQRTLRLLVGDGKYQTFPITTATEFRDPNGRRLPQGLDAPELIEEELAMILMTDDRQGLQWLKLGGAK